MTDGFDFERFEQEMHSQLDLEDHEPTLVEEAKHVLRQHPEAQPVGLILHTEAVEARAFVQAIELRTGRPFRQRGLVGLVPRNFVVEMLRSNYPEMLAVFPAEGHGRKRKLPTLCITRGGARMGISEVNIGQDIGQDTDSEGEAEQGQGRKERRTEPASDRHRDPMAEDDCGSSRAD